MIQETDLKPYNLVGVKGDAAVYTVLGILLPIVTKQEYGQVWLDRPHGTCEAVRTSQIKGIPLTDFTAKKLGFVFAGAHYFHPLNPDWFIWNFTKGKSTIFKTITHHRNIGNKAGESYTELRYVHELQNSFYEANKVVLPFDNYEMTEK